MKKHEELYEILLLFSLQKDILYGYMPYNIDLLLFLVL
jgi:hypothetical protein